MEPKCDISGPPSTPEIALERATTHEQQLKGECLMLADVLRDAYEVVKTIEGEDSDECDKLQDLRMSMEYALAMYDERRIETANAGIHRPRSGPVE